MDSHYLACGVSGAGLSVSSEATTSSMPAGRFTSIKFDSRISPNSPFSTHFDTDAVPTYSVSQEQNSSDNLSEDTTASTSSLDFNNYLQQSVASPFCLEDGQLIHSTGTLHLRNADDSQHLRHALLKLESDLMAADVDDELITSGDVQSRTPGRRSRTWNQEGKLSCSGWSESPCDSWFGSSKDEGHIEQRGRAVGCFAPPNIPSNDIKQLLVECARALSESKLDEFEKLVQHARAAVSIRGEPIQRLGAYMVEGLIARKESSGANFNRALKCNEPDSKDLISYMRILYEICPYLKFGYVAANGAIAEACRNEDRIHIIDFQIAQGMQWITLLQALAGKPGGAPHVRITVIDDPILKNASGDCIGATRRRFAAISEKFNIPVEFHRVPIFSLNLTREMLDVRPGEALAMNFPLRLHRVPDESVDVFNPRDGLLRMVKSLSPKVVTLVEQELNANTAPFLSRFTETLSYYSALFESIDITVPRGSKERIDVEQHFLARDIVNVIACEGKERVERHELLGKWRSRFMMAGFQQFPLSAHVNSVIKGLLSCYSDRCTLTEKDGGTLLGWKDRNLISVSAWH